MRIPPFLVCCAVIGATATPAHAIHVTPGCPKVAPVELSKNMVASYPDHWQKWEETKLGFILLVPGEFIKVENSNSHALAMRTDWCGDAPKVGDALRMEATMYNTERYQKQHRGGDQNKHARDFLSKMVFPNIAQRHTDSDTVMCGEKQFKRTTSSSTNNSLNFTRQTFAVESGAETLELIFSYSTSNLPADKSATDLYVHNNGVLECNILQHAELVPTPAAPKTGE